MSALSIYAGPTALRRIRNEGLHAEQFSVLVGASGGPKWFVLYGLDRYLFGDFFANRTAALYTLGSSAGAWRLCCLAMADPVSAIDRLATLYSQERYSDAPGVAEVTESARTMLKSVLGSEGARDIVANSVIRTHILADRCRGQGTSNSRIMQSLMLGSGAIANGFSRKALSVFFQRFIFSNRADLSPWKKLKGFDTRLVELTEENVFQALLASGSIPFVLEGVRDIPGAAKGLYWDGGIVDYHFDMPFHDGGSLVLFPHFSASIIPGWFDKHLPWRQVHEEYLHNVVLVAPSAEFVATLPGQKIPDRKDFARLDNDTRIRVFQEVLDRSKQLAEDFARLVDEGIGLDGLLPIADRNR